MLRGILAQDLENVVGFIYNGEANVFQNDLRRFLDIAEELQLKGLAHLDDGLSEGISTTNDQRGLLGIKEVFSGNFEGQDVFETPKTGNDKQFERKPIIVHTKNFEKEPVKIKPLTEQPRDSKPQTANILTEETVRIVEQLYENQNGAWACLQCAYTSKQRSHLREHVQKHIEGLEFPCHRCGKISKSSHTFRDHMRKKH